MIVDIREKNLYEVYVVMLRDSTENGQESSLSWSQIEQLSPLIVHH